MKTLLVSEVFPPRIGGSARYSWEIYRRLPRTQVMVAAGAGTAEEASSNRTHDLAQADVLDLAHIPLQFPDLGLTSIPEWAAYARATRAVLRLVDEHHIQRLHCARCVPEGWVGMIVKRVRGLPYICTAHGEEVNLDAAGAGHGVMSSRQLRWMTRAVIADAEALIPSSLNTRRILNEQWGVDDSRLHVLQPGVDTTRFMPAPRDFSIRTRLGWGSRPVILTVGRLVARKGHASLIETLATIRQSVPDVLYAIVGSGPEGPALQSLVAERGLAGCVQFHGEIDDAAMIDAYQQCDLFVLPNRQVHSEIEGFGMVLLEVQACGKPVIAGDSGGTAEAINAPATGLVLDCDNVPELASQIVSLLLDEPRRATMGAAARHWTVQRFDWSVVGREACRILDLSPQTARLTGAFS